MWLEIEYNDNLLHFIPLFEIEFVIVFRLSLDIPRCSVRSFALTSVMLAVNGEYGKVTIKYNHFNDDDENCLMQY